MAIKIRRKPLELEAMRFDGSKNSAEAIIEWVRPREIWEVSGRNGDPGRALLIPTWEGDMVASPGDYIVRGTAGEFYPVKAEIFPNIYDILE